MRNEVGIRELSMSDALFIIALASSCALRKTSSYTINDKIVYLEIVVHGTILWSPGSAVAKVFWDQEDNFLRSTRARFDFFCLDSNYACFNIFEVLTRRYYSMLLF